MSIKKISSILSLFILMAISFQASATSRLVVSTMHSTSSIININSDSLKIEAMKVRLAEIQSMDLSDLSARQKSDLKTELVSMKKEATTMNEDGGSGGVYLSIGAIIVIILLLILILR